MSSLGSPNPFFIAGKKAYEVERSLRFNDDDTAYLERNVTSSSNRKTHTFSAWIKRCEFGDYHLIYTQGDNAGNEQFYVFFNNNDQIEMQQYDYPTNQGQLKTTQKFRDPSAWYHIVMRVDTTNSTADDRFRIYVNGEQVTSFETRTNPSQNLDTWINDTTYNFRIGATGFNGMKMDGYMAEVNFLDGYAYDASYFAETDAITGQWIPKKYTGSYGTNGFYLNFSDNSGITATTMGKDSSGNGNNFTPNNFAVSDAVKDTPSNNFCTWNPLENFDNVALSEGNLRANGVAGFDMIKGNMGVSSGKWYFEIEADAIYANTWSGGIHELYPNPNYAQAYWYANYYTAADYGHVYAVMDNNKRCTNGSQTTFTSDITAGDIIGFRLDLDNNELSISVNGTDKGKLYDIQGGVTYTPAQQGYATSSKAVLNCGQDSTFAGAVSSGGNTDANGIGDFKYAVPSGYKAICSANLPDPTILLPNKHFGTILYTGDNTDDRNITDSSAINFTPDWVWHKARNAANYHFLFDSIRGATKFLVSNSTGAESTQADSLSAFITNGFTVSDNTANADMNSSSHTYAAWNWNAGDTDGKTYAVTVVSDSGNKYRFDGFGTSAVTLDLAEGGTYIFDQSDSSNAGHPLRFSTTSNGTHGGGTEYTTGVTTAGAPGSSGAYTQIVVAASAPTLYYYCTQHSGMGGQVNTNSTLGSSNFDGSIQSRAKVNATAGFSIVTYTGNGTGGATIGHGLGVAPNWIIAKVRNASRSWAVGSDDSTWSFNLRLDESSGRANTSQSKNQWYETAPTSTKFYVGDGDVGDYSGDTNVNGENYVAYCFSSVEGYSKAGSYTGNGSNDGTFIYTGFRPAFVLLKSTNLNVGWYILDNKRDPDNFVSRYLRADTNADEDNDEFVDFLANGFKQRYSDTAGNGSGDSYIYLAFAESPFKNARAR